MVQDWLSIGFHVFALFFIFKSYQALNLLKAEKEQEQVQEFSEEEDSLGDTV